MSMARRDYAMLARLLAEHMEAADSEGDAAGVLALDTFGRDLVNHLDAANPNFDRPRFTAAAGMSEGFRADV
jgi:hypothetical protein